MSTTLDSSLYQPPPTLVARAVAMGEAESVLDAARRGRGGFILVSGESGVGKTVLASAISSRAVANGMDIYWTTCSPQAATAPAYWAWSRLLEECLSRADDGDRDELTNSIEPILAIMGPGFSADSTSATRRPPLGDHFAVFQAIARFWTLAARQHPMLIIIDDLHWADVASIRMLAYLSTELRHLPVILLGTVRTGEPISYELVEPLSALDISGPMVLQLRGLSTSALAELMQASGLGPNSAVAAMLYQRTAGNPYLATELIRMLDRDADGTALLEALASQIPDHVSRVVRRRVDTLEPAVRALLEAASVIGPAGEVAVLAVTAGVDLSTCVETLDAATDLGMLMRVGTNRWRFVHTVLTDVVAAGLPAPLRDLLQERASEGLAAAAEPASLTATHAQAALEADRGIQLMLQAGKEHMSRREFDPAADCFARAIQLNETPTGEADGAMQLQLGEALRAGGHDAEARTAFRAAAEAAGGDVNVLAAAALGLAESVLGLDLPRRAVDDDARAALQNALVALGDAQTPLRARLMARLSLESFHSGGWKLSRRLIDEAVELASRTGDDVVLVEAMALRHGLNVVGLRPAAEALAESADILRLAQATGDLRSRWMAHRMRLFDQLVAGDLTAAGTEMLALVRVCEQMGCPPTHQWWVALWQGMLALLAGRHSEVEATEAGVAEPLILSSNSEAAANELVQRVFLRREQARLAELEPEVLKSAANSPYSPATDTLAAFRAAEMGRIDEAADALRRLASQFDDMQDHRDWPGLWFQLSRVAYLASDRVSAAALYKLGQHLAGECVLISLAACGGAADLGLAWLADTLGEVEQAGHWYDSAEVINVRVDARPWLAQTRVDHARLLVGRDKSEASRLAELAVEAADRLALPTVRALGQSVLGLASERRAKEPIASARAPEDLATFRRRGVLWEISYGGMTVHLPQAKGLVDLHILLGQPGDPVHVSQLVSLQSAGTPVAPGSDEVFDGRARREIRQRLTHLADEAADAEARSDLARAESVRAQRAELVASLSSALGLGGKARRLNDPMERARKTVSARIHSSMGRIGQAHPVLGRHLERSIDTGLWCVYRPEQPIKWQT